jgi:hypothetical protein
VNNKALEAKTTVNMLCKIDEVACIGLSSVLNFDHQGVRNGFTALGSY